MNFAFEPTQADFIRWGISAGIFAVFLALAFLSRIILSGIVRLLAHRTKTTLDDLINKSLTGPVFTALIAAGLWIALARLTELDPYDKYIHQGFAVLYIIIAAVAVVRVVNALLTWYGTEVATRTQSDVDDRLVPIFKRIADVIIYGIALILILDQLGMEISPILAGLGIGGLAVALALQSTLINFLAGTYVITDAVIRKGHYISMDGGPEGWVEDIGWRTTKLRHWQGNLVVIPNSKLSEAIVTDYEKPEASMLFAIDCGVSYSSDLDKVEKVTLDVARKLLKENPAGAKDFEPVLRFNKFGDSNINFAVVLKGVDRAAQYILKHEFIKELNKRFQQEGIRIEYPARRLYFDSVPGTVNGLTTYEHKSGEKQEEKHEGKTHHPRG
ncbi:MAG: mechanosensitive ion channel family protein [Dehalococcoidia bacterium]|nr:mechanosensitive ion channel family protein [Dehalococcoidia bacterium]